MEKTLNQTGKLCECNQRQQLKNVCTQLEATVHNQQTRIGELERRIWEMESAAEEARQGTPPCDYPTKGKKRRRSMSPEPAVACRECPPRKVSSMPPVHLAETHAAYNTGPEPSMYVYRRDEETDALRFSAPPAHQN
jgi:hypothetical protein